MFSRFFLFWKYKKNVPKASYVLALMDAPLCRPVVAIKPEEKMFQSAIWLSYTDSIASIKSP